jgi:hypothetical protein
VQQPHRGPQTPPRTPSPWPPPPDVDRVVHGLPTKLDRQRIRALGNSIVPAVAQQLIACITSVDPC